VLVFFSLSNYSYFINITYYIAISSNQMNISNVTIICCCYCYGIKSNSISINLYCRRKRL